MELILSDIDIEPLVNAKKNLDQVINKLDSWIQKTAAIKCFEYTYELSWKTMKKVLNKKGSTVSLPRDVFRVAADNGLIEDPEFWFEAIEYRNLTSHTYKETMADKVIGFLPSFQKEVDKLIQTLRLLK